MLVILKSIPVMLLWFYINTHCFVHDRSSSASQFNKGKPRDLLKLLIYLSRIITSIFKGGTGGCAGLSVSPGSPDFGGISGIFLSNFVLTSLTFWWDGYFTILPTVDFLLITQKQ